MAINKGKSLPSSFDSSAQSSFDHNDIWTSIAFHIILISDIAWRSNICNATLSTNDPFPIFTFGSCNRITYIIFLHVIWKLIAAIALHIIFSMMRWWKKKSFKSSICESRNNNSFPSCTSLHRYDRDKEYDGTSTVKQSEASDYKNNAPWLDWQCKHLYFISQRVVPSQNIEVHPKCCHIVSNIASSQYLFTRLENTSLESWWHNHTRKTSKTHRYLIRLLIAKKLWEERHSHSQSKYEYHTHFAFTLVIAVYTPPPLSHHRRYTNQHLQFHEMYFLVNNSETQRQRCYFSFHMLSKRYSRLGTWE